MQALPSEDARAVRPQERRHHEVADLDGANVRADGFDAPMNSAPCDAPGSLCSILG
jgi:hypothetical protein